MMINDDLSELAARLDGLRGTAGLTLRELGRRLHISDSSLSRYFTGQTMPAWNVVQGLAELAGGDPDELRALWDAAALARKRVRRPSGREKAARPAPPSWEPDLPRRLPSAVQWIAAAAGVLLMIVITTVTIYALSLDDYAVAAHRG